MSRFTVTWHRGAEDDLAEIWLSASDRDDATAAVRAIDTALANDPESTGQAVAEGLRYFNAPPLRVLFVVRVADRIAEIEVVRRL